MRQIEGGSVLKRRRVNGGGKVLRRNLKIVK